MKRVFQKAADPLQRPRTCPPQPLLETLSQLSQGAHHDKGINEKKFLERPGGVSPPLKRTVRVPITATMEFRGSGAEKKRHPPPPPLPTSPRPSVATESPMTSFQSEVDRSRPTSPPSAAPMFRNEGFTYPGGSDLARRRSSLRTKTRRYGDDLPVFNNGIGGGPVQRYPNLEDRYQPLFPVQPPSPTAASFSHSYHAAGAQQQQQQQQPRRSGRP